MSVGGGHPGEVVKFKVLTVAIKSVLLEIGAEDVKYFADKVGKHGIADFRFGNGGQHPSGSEESGGKS